LQCLRIERLKSGYDRVTRGSGATRYLNKTH
jgi:hypothetical protein